MTLIVFPEKAFPVLFRLIVQSLAVGIPAGFIQQALLQKRTGIRIWWAVAVLFSIASVILIDRGNATIREGFAMIDPIYASIIAGLVMASLTSLPTLLLKPVEKAGQDIPKENPDPANSISTDSVFTDPPDS